MSILRTRLERTTVAAVRRYVPRTFPGRVNLFLPSWTWARSPAKALRWRALAQQSEVYVGPEDCQWDRMLRPPSAHAIAELFARARDDQETQTALKPGA